MSTTAMRWRREPYQALHIREPAKMVCKWLLWRSFLSFGQEQVVWLAVRVGRDGWGALGVTCAPPCAWMRPRDEDVDWPC